MYFDPDAFAHGPIESKIWLCNALRRLVLAPINNVYVLGAWSGTMAFLLHSSEAIAYNRIINVDIDLAALAQSRKICNAIECNGKLLTVAEDCNMLAYPLDQHNLIINTSTDNISGDTWFRKIPSGTLVALQGRSGGHWDDVRSYPLINEFDQAYPMSTTLLLDSRELMYPDHSYTRYMKIGIK